MARVQADRAKPKVVLALQGGGALGAYHIGAYEALKDAGYEPDWIAGVSIGAINAALLAGNEPVDRLSALETFWNRISRDDAWIQIFEAGMRRTFNTISNFEALSFGQPNFFTPRFLNPYLASALSLGAPGATSFYDTTPLLAILEELASFEMINRRNVRLSLGATNVLTGEIEFFDNSRPPITVITPKHVAASGSLPPGFPAQEIDGKLYWDGGCVSNTPLEAVLADEPTEHTLVFVIDLWPAVGKAPQTLDEVLWRQKQIQYASRTAQHIDAVATKMNLQCALKMLADKSARTNVPVPADPALSEGVLDIVHVTYEPTKDEIPSSDAEFSRLSIAQRRQAGYDGLNKALSAAPWLTHPRAYPVKAMVHKVEGGEITTTTMASLRATAGAHPASSMA
jgi:NTE family protein